MTENLRKQPACRHRDLCSCCAVMTMMYSDVGDDGIVIEYCEKAVAYWLESAWGSEENVEVLLNFLN